MEISIGGLLFLALFAFYLWNEHNKEVLRLEKEKLERDREIKRLQSQNQPPLSAPPERIHTVETIREKETIYVPFPVQQPPQKLPYQALPSAKTFVQVIFKKNSKRRYDYYLGDNYDVRVGDFVEVYAYDKWAGKSRLKIAKVLYISAPGQTSAYANTVIEGKTVQPKWWR